MSNLGKRIYNLRKDMNLTQDQFGAKLKIHGRQLARYEATKAIPSIETIKRISDFCEVSIDYLIYGKDKKLISKTKLNDLQLLDLFRRVDRLKKGQRDRIKWGIEALLDKEAKA